MNRQMRLKSRPDGVLQAHHFEIARTPVPTPGPGQVLVQNAWWSVAPAMRGWVNAVVNYAELVAVGAVMRAFAAGHVVASHGPAWPVGTAVTGLFGWQDFAVVDGWALSAASTRPTCRCPPPWACWTSTV